MNHSDTAKRIISGDQARMPKFKVGQVVVFERTGKRAIVLEVNRDEGEFFYRLDKKNYFHEPMLRELTPAEKGEAV